MASPLSTPEEDGVLHLAPHAMPSNGSGAQPSAPLRFSEFELLEALSIARSKLVEICVLLLALYVIIEFNSVARGCDLNDCIPAFVAGGGVIDLDIMTMQCSTLRLNCESSHGGADPGVVGLNVSSSPAYVLCRCLLNLGHSSTLTDFLVLNAFTFILGLLIASSQDWLCTVVRKVARGELDVAYWQRRWSLANCIYMTTPLYFLFILIAYEVAIREAGPIDRRRVSCIISPASAICCLVTGFILFRESRALHALVAARGHGSSSASRKSGKYHVNSVEL